MKQLSLLFHSKSFWLVTGVLVFAGLTHGINMFHYPYYENDEGTYMSQAWSLLKFGKLAPYTYWYDHAPGGWMLIAVWTFFTGGFFTFGTSVNSGRVLMLLIHIATTFFMLSISKKLTGSYVSGVIAACVFSLSPLGVYFQRRVLLDNMMIFWVFLSIWLLFRPVLQLRYVFFSAITFSIAVLTKENAIFFLPAFLYWIYSNSQQYNRRFALTSWLAVSLSIISVYFLYALLKSEFFPVGFLGNNQPHVSMLKTLQEQYSRGGTLPFWNMRSDFIQNLKEWLSRDPITILAGIYSTSIGLFLSIKVKTLRLPTFFAVLFWLFLLRGKLVLDFYIVPIIPLLAMGIGMLTAYLLKKLTYHKPLAYSSLLFLLLGLLTMTQIVKLKDYYTRDETTPQTQTIAWIKQNVPSNANIVIDDSIYLDLHDRKTRNEKVFPNADWAWKIDKDPEIQQRKLNDDWKNIQYVALSHEILKQIKNSQFSLLKNALDNSYEMADFAQGSTSYRNIPQYISTNGDWMSVYKVMNKNEIMLNLAWKSDKTNYIHSYGQVIDPATGITTSNYQATAMLQAVWMNDKKTYDGLWQWTKDHLQWRMTDKLLSSVWLKKNGTYQLDDSGSSSSADQDIALSLLFAAKQWNDPAYLTEARPLIADIWKKEVKKVDNTYYLLAGTDTTTAAYYLSNPSTLSPASYRIFAQVDPSHPWNQLAADSYGLLSQLPPSSSPHEVLIDQTNGKVLLAPTLDQYSRYNTIPFTGRLAFDAKWFNSSQAIAYLKKLDHTSLAHAATENQANRVITKSTLNNHEAKNIFTDSLAKDFSYATGYWSNNTGITTQANAWISSGIYANRLPNLWGEDSSVKLSQAEY